MKYINKKDDFSHLPESCLSTLGQLAFVMELELTPDRTLAHANAEKVCQQLETKGFFIQLPPTMLTEHVTLQ